ncbi:hypothetical protein LTR78_009191 [Recurvomyces mirabilis]|uniref:Uncharacterized protein n=1 Tax=Recurvomyces mirabilis TaxID=574656 RepID=A0AAE0WIQ9_9PEZI|nr:hypothetical protein LTR78_009191 [Recurvomyces mirabilis]KAK5155649.1 hypothetical protein LTS14_005910 [Recurvomyces mirabilis]
MADPKAEEIASSEGGPKPDRSSVARDTAASDAKMENSLELNKANKVHTTDASEVAGHQGKGTGLLDKLTPGKK